MIHAPGDLRKGRGSTNSRAKAKPTRNMARLVRSKVGSAGRSFTLSLCLAYRGCGRRKQAVRPGGSGHSIRRLDKFGSGPRDAPNGNRKGNTTSKDLAS